MSQKCFPVAAIGAGMGSPAVQVTTTPTTILQGVLVSALAGNTVPVFVGLSTVTPGTDAATGIPVLPGGTIYIPKALLSADLSNVWVVAASGSNTVYVTPDCAAP